MIRQLVGDARVQLATLEPGSIQSCITSPPYWGLRDYGTDPLVWGGDSDCAHEWGQTERRSERQSKNGLGSSSLSKPHSATFVVLHETLGKTAGTFCPCGAWLGSLGLEPTPELFISHLVELFRGVRRVLRDDGTLWLNLGDSYAGSGKGPSNSLNKGNPHAHEAALTMGRNTSQYANGQAPTTRLSVPGNAKPKDLLMIPARVAIALQADGWYLRSMIPWLKRNSMPESVTDRPSSAVEYWFLLSKSRTYYFDADSIRVGNGREATPSEYAAVKAKGTWESGGIGRYAGALKSASVPTLTHPNGRNRRNTDWFFETWQGLMLDEEGDPLALVVNPQPLKLAHFASFPTRLIEPMVKASTRPGHTVLDCFGGSGTVGLVADRLGRDAVLIDLKPEYSEMATGRLVGDAPMFVQIEGGASGMSPEPVKDKQAATGAARVKGGDRYSGFNARWDAKEQGA